MQCTAEEIEEKRRQALARLAQKRKLPSTSHNQQSNNNKHPCIQPLTPVKTNLQNSFPHSPFKSNISNLQNKQFSPQSTSYIQEITVTCSLISDIRFETATSGFSSQIIDVFKTMPNRSFDPNSKKWSFHVRDHDLLAQKLSGLTPRVTIDRVPKFALKCLQNTDQEAAIDLSKIELELFNTLMPFQRDGVSFGIQKKGRCLIADDMGLGKTYQALAIASYYRDDWPLLIVTTATMKNVWEGTIQKYMPSVNLLHIQYMVSSKDYISEAKILIVSHDMMTRCGKILLDRRFGVIVIDESHTFKNFKAKCTTVAKDLTKAARRVILLSGTPALSRPSELYMQLSFIDEKFFGSFFEYSKRYCDAVKTNFGWDSSGKSNLKELEVVLAKRFMIRRTKEEVLQSLPEKEREIVRLDVKFQQLSVRDREHLNALAAAYLDTKKATDKHAALLVFFSETARIKIPSVCTYVLSLLEDKNEKFLVFAHHKIMLDALEEQLNKKAVNYIRIDGSTTSDQRKYFVDKFQTKCECRCALLSITAANAGITLTAAKTVVFAELHWNPSILSQAESRAHRIGQQNQVQIKYLLAVGTADDSIWPLLISKQSILSEVGLNKDTFKDASVTEQTIKNVDSSLKGNTTVTGTKDIASYFDAKEEEKPKEEVDFDSFLDDDFDDCLKNIDLDNIQS